MWAPGGQQHDGGIGDAGGRDAAQILEQHVRIMIDRRDAVLGEQLRKQPHHHLAVLEHVRDAGGHAQVVLEHAKFAGIVAHDIDAGDVRVNAAGHVDALHLRAVLRIAEHLLGGNHAGLQNLLVVVDVVNEGIERPDPLFQTALETNPFLERQHAGHDVERDQPLRTLFLSVNRESDADPVEQGIGLGALLREPIRRLMLEPLGIAQVMGARRAALEIHFVVRSIAQKAPCSSTERIPCQSVWYNP